MPPHRRQEILPYTVEQLYALVADVERYPEFIPWCSAARIVESKGNTFLAELAIQYGMLKERYSSEVQLFPPDQTGQARIDATMVKGPFKYLINQWKFSPQNGATQIDFLVDFQFSSPLLERMMGNVFMNANDKIMKAFVECARARYAS